MTPSSRRGRDGRGTLRALLIAALLGAALAGQETSSRPKKPLADEKSPYLRQHVDNPVTWYPWGEQAFAKAASENKPIFLSIGYASCHWCHVMEKESFENPDVARLLNESYVPIKVDREERPDVDRVYMQAVTAMTGRGGWPLSLFLTSEKKPFFGGTYIPLDDQPNQTGFKTMLVAIRDAWKTRRDTLVGAANRLEKILRLDQLSPAELEARVQALESRPEGEAASRRGAAAAELEVVREILAKKKAATPPNFLSRACEELLRMEDKEHGGFGDSPKFPVPADALALLRLFARGNAPAALEAVRRQYDAMARGGIHDQLAGGFHRYATDRKWEVPHFEKMLYDQALIARVYLELGQATGDESYEAICRKTLDFCLSRMRAREGGFIAAFDASVDGTEGLTYLWTKEEVEAALPGDQNRPVRATFERWAGFDQAKPGERLTIAERAPATPESAGNKERADSIFNLTLAFRQLLSARDQRRQPDAIGHVITGWNAWLVSSLARAGMVLNETRYLAAAVATMGVLEAKLRRPDGLYARRWVEGETRFSGELADQAAVVEAMLDLHEATLDPAWLDRAVALVDLVQKRYGRPDGSFHDSVEPDLLYRTREVTDGAVPSGISVMNVALARIARMTGRPEDLLRAKRAIEAVLPDMSASPADNAYGAIAWDLVFGSGGGRVVFAGPRPIVTLLRAPLLLKYRPNLVMTAEKGAEDSRASAVFWSGGAASKPAFDSAELLKAVDGAPGTESR